MKNYLAPLLIVLVVIVGVVYTMRPVSVSAPTSGLVASSTPVASATSSAAVASARSPLPASTSTAIVANAMIKVNDTAYPVGITPGETGIEAMRALQSLHSAVRWAVAAKSRCYGRRLKNCLQLFHRRRALWRPVLVLTPRRAMLVDFSLRAPAQSLARPLHLGPNPIGILPFRVLDRTLLFLMKHSEYCPGHSLLPLQVQLVLQEWHLLAIALCL